MAIISNPHIWAGLGLITIYWTGAYFLPFYVVYELVVGLLIGMASAVAVLYAPVALRAVKDGRFDRLTQLSLGIVITMVAVVGARSWHLLWRVRGKPDWMIESDVLTFFFFLTLIGCLLHATAPSAGISEMPRKSFWVIMTAVGLGALLAGYIIGVGLAH